MSNGSGSGKRPSKPFLGDDDVSELDAWDATFDALHADTDTATPSTPPIVVAPAAPKLATPLEPDPSASATLEVDAEAIARLARAETPAPIAPRAPTVVPTTALDELDDQFTLDNAIEAPEDDTTSSRPAVVARAPEPAVELDDHNETNETIERELSPAMTPAQARAHQTTPPPATPVADESDFSDVDVGDTPLPRPPAAEEDDDVFTSASRPRAPAAPPSDELSFEDDLAPPPPPTTRSNTPTRPPPVERAPTVPRQGPAIIRRSIPDLSKPPTPVANDAGMFGDENTRVSSIHEIEARRAESRPFAAPDVRPARGATVPAPPDDDDDYELEIEAPVADRPSATALAPTPSEDAPGRRTAHVLRRQDQITKPPPMGHSQPIPVVKPLATDDDEHVIEMSVGDDDDDAPSAPKPAPRGLAPLLPPVSGTLPLRAPAPTAPPPIAPAAATPRPPTPTPSAVPTPVAAEDDFSDVAASFHDDEPRASTAPPVEVRPPTVPPTARIGTAPPDLELGPSGKSSIDALGDLPLASALGDLELADAPIVPPPASAIDDEPPPFDDDDLGDIGASTLTAAVPPPPLAPIAPVARPATPSQPPATVAPISPHAPRVKTPTSVPPLGLQDQIIAARTAVPAAVATEPSRPVAVPTLAPSVTGEPIEIVEPALDLDTIGRAWPEQAPPLAAGALDESLAQALLVYEREIQTVDDTAQTAALRIEAGRLSERLGDLDRARGHYDAALLADPRATTALRGLRRLARASGDLAEATRHLDAELAVAGGLERRPLGHYRIDLLMASGEQDLARVAVGEILDSAPSDVRALLAQLELAFLDGRADEFGSALEQLATAISDPELRAAVQSARGVLAAHHNDTAGAASWFAAAAESDPTSLSARLGAIRQAAADANADGAARGLVELARQLEGTDRTTAAAAAVRAQQWATGELAIVAAQLALDGAPDDPLVARLAADTALATATAIAAAPAEDADAHARAVADARTVAAQALARWARSTASPSEQAYASARAAELDPTNGIPLWQTALAFDPSDDYAAAQLRTAHVAADATEAAIGVDLGVANDLERERARLRAAYGLIANNRLDDALAVLREGRAARPGSLALAEALAEALAAANRWHERAELLAELARPREQLEPPLDQQLDHDVAALRSALAWEEAVGAAASGDDPSAPDAAAQRAAITRGLDAWARVLETTPAAPAAHAASLLLAKRLGDRDVVADALARAQAAERSPWAALGLALERARATADHAHAEEILRDAAPHLDDPRRTVALVRRAATRKELGDVAAVLEERAALLDGADAQGSPDATEAATLRLRAAQLALDGGDALRATALLGKVEVALPHVGIVSDLLAAARRRSGDRPTPIAQVRRDAPAAAASPDAFARTVRDADLAASHEDHAGALALYQRALEMRPGDPLAAVPLVRVATHLREAAPIAALALAQLKEAQAAGDGPGTATAYELLARIDHELREDPGSAQLALESASQADPTRVDLLHRLERLYTEQDQLAELVRLRALELETIPASAGRDRAAALVDLAGLAARDHRAEVEVADHYRAALAADPKTRLALLQLEAIVRRAGASVELAELEDKIAQYFAADPRAAASFQTRSGETLAEVGQIDVAVQRFVAAEATLPGHVPALEGWRAAALKGQLWVDAAAAATRQAELATDPKVRATLHHFAGVALMDKALAGDRAMPAFHAALEADPSHTDAFLRLRILLEEDANHDELALLLARRLDYETEPRAQMEMHRALAELCRNFLSDRDGAKKHYRAILAIEPNDLRAHSAIADIAWEQGAWQEAADALVARARLERQPEVLKTLCFRLGLIYADYLVDVPMALTAFQRALTFAPDDLNTLVRLADLAAAAGEWKLALGACERLVKQETDPERRVAHLHRVAKIFKAGFNDAKRAERALNLALDGAPTSDDALAALVQFYRDANDLTSVRVHLNRVAGTMRARAAQDPKDGVAYRVVARAMAARAQAGVPGSLPIARAAAQLAELCGAAGEPEAALLAQQVTPDLAQLARTELDEVLFPRTVQPEIRSLFSLLGDRVAKHVGVSLQPYGVARGDRQRARDSAIASTAQAVATGLGFGEIDVYVSPKQPWVMVAEPTSPASLVIGAGIAEAGTDAIRFAAGSALKLAQVSLAIPARLALDELGVLVVALLRLFQPDFPLATPRGTLDADAIGAQLQKLRRLIPNNLMTELRAYGLAIDGQRFDHHQLAIDLKIAGLRAGLVASGSIQVGLQILAAQAGIPLTELLGRLHEEPVAQGLIAFALGEDHAAVAR